VSFQYDSTYRRIMTKLAARYSLGLIFNNIRTEEAGDNTRYFNSAYFLDSYGALTGIYDKIHLVPFGEYIPLKRLFAFVETISKDVGSFYPGRNDQVLKIGNHPANAIICFEAVFPDLVRRSVRKGSQLIVNLTNDGWYGDSAAPYQHLAIARLRAVESRRYLLRATNSGISAIIGPSGRIQASTGLLREDICKGRFAFIAHKTLYTRYGNFFVFLCAIISVGSWIFVEFHRAAVRKHQ
jgi:apolipoprotein N-acyltransferase